MDESLHNGSGFEIEKGRSSILVILLIQKTQLSQDIKMLIFHMVLYNTPWYFSL